MIIDTKNSQFWKVVEYVFYGFFLTFPFINYSSFLYGGTSTRSLNLVIVAAVLGIGLAVWLVVQRGKGVAIAKSPLMFALTAYLLAMTVSGIFGSNFSMTFWSVATRTTGLWYFLSLGIFICMLWAVVRKDVVRDRIIAITIGTSALYSLLYLVGPQGLDWFFLGTKTDALTFGNSSFAAMYLFGAFLLALYYLYQVGVKKWWIYVLPFVILINPAFIEPRIWSGDFSKGLIGDARASIAVVLLSLGTLLCVWIISMIKVAQTRSVVAYGLYGVGVLAAVILSFSLLSPGGYVREAYLSIATAARPLVWEVSEKAIAERPVLGWGADNFERVFETRIDNRLLQDEYGNEAWFDRAHNIYMDQMLDNGIFGLLLYLLVYLITTLALLYTALNARERKDSALASVLLVYFALHLAELQTAFDTSVSYPMLAFLFVLSTTLFQRTWYGEAENSCIELPAAAGYVVAAILFTFCSWSLIAGALPFARAQIANGEIRTVGSAEKRIPLYPALFGSPLDIQAFIWRTAIDFQRGIAEDPRVVEDPEKAAWLAKEAIIYEEVYRDFLKSNPTNFRAHLSLADILIYQVLFGEQKLEEARAILDKAMLLVPQSPQPYWMKTVTYVYEGKFELARETAKKGLALNPEIKQSQNVITYIERSTQNFPEIDLFFFTQI